MPSTKVTKTTYSDADGVEREQYRTTVPKNVAELLDLEDAELDWEAKSRNTIELKVVRDE